MSPELREAYRSYDDLVTKVIDLTLKKALELKNKGAGIRMPEGSSWGKKLTFGSPCTIITLKRKLEVGPEVEIQGVAVFDKKCIVLFNDTDMDIQKLNLYDQLQLVDELEQMLDESKN